MPFALIAVTILLISGMYAVVAAHTERNSDNVENISKDLEKFDSSVEAFRNEMNRGMGEIVAAISLENIPNGLIGCSEVFNERAERWMRGHFPMSDGIVTARLKDHDISLSIGSLKLTEKEAVMPTYLRASGTVSVTVSSGSGSAEKEIPISADSTATLPFLLENISLFEMSTGGEMSLLSQMISYQLTSLAQYRVMQGYGMYEAGRMSTDKILTAHDVRKAFDSSLAVIETICFRNTSDGTDWTGREYIDPAEHFLADQEYIEVDMEAVFAQSMMSLIDELTLKWFDYLMIDKLIDFFEKIIDELANIADKLSSAVRGLVNAIKGKDDQTAAAWRFYEDVMKDAGLKENEYRYIPGISTTLVSESSIHYAEMPSGQTQILVPSMELNVSVERTDISKWGGWHRFMENYRHETRWIEEAMRSFLKGMSLKIAESYNMGTIRIGIDKHDLNSLTDAMSSAMNRELDSIVKHMHENGRLGDAAFTDPMFAYMFDEMSKDRNRLFKTEESIRNDIRIQLEEQISGQLKEMYGTILDPGFSKRVASSLMNSDEINDIVREYKERADERMVLYQGVLDNVKKKGALAMAVFSDIAAKGLLLLDLYPAVEKRMRLLIEEMRKNIEMNSVSGVQHLPGTDHFLLADNKGNTHKEKITVSRTEDVSIQVKMGKAVHYTDVNGLAAPYSLTFDVKIDAEIELFVSSSSEFSEMIGQKGAEISDTVTVDSNITVSAISGWPLSNVDYETSWTIADDIGAMMDKVWKYILEMLEPILGPLRELYRMMSVLSVVFGTALIEISEYMTEVAENILSAVSNFLEVMHAVAEAVLIKLFEGLEIFIKTFTPDGKADIIISYYEFELQITANVKDIIFNNKANLKISLFKKTGSTVIGGSLTIKKTEKGEIFLSGSASYSSGGTEISVSIDPLMKIRKHLVEISGCIRGIDFRVTLPEMVQYDMIDLRLSEMLPPGIASMLSSIPVPIPGMKGSLDAGLELKYNSPVEFGVLINEFESNPEGDDGGKEWVELYNSTNDTVDIEGYVLMPGTNESNVLKIGNMSIAAKGRVVIDLPKRMLNNSTGKAGTGEKITLFDKDGNEVDSTPWKSDTKNNDSTWQRDGDASASWVFKKNTKGETNGGKITWSKAMVHILYDAVEKAVKDVNLISDLNDLTLLVQKILETVFMNIAQNIAGCITEASAFVEVMVSDITGTGHTGIRLALMMNESIVIDVFEWMVHQIRQLFGHLDNPSNIKPKKPAFEVLIDNVFIQFSVFTMVTAPKILKPLSKEEMPKVEIAMIAECNLSSVYSLMGKNKGQWKANFGIVIENVPSELVPKAYKVGEGKSADLWLIRGEFW
jgi:hypothetical protein